MTYQIEGELVPLLHCSLDGSMAVYFEHHVVLWKEPQMGIKLKAVRGAVRRVVAGRPLFLTEAKGRGDIAFSRDAPGQVFPLELPRGAAILAREHQFLAATASLRYSASHLRGLSNNLFGNNGFWVDRFDARDGDGVVWLHGFGNVFEKQLGAGEEIDVEPGGWGVYGPRGAHASGGLWPPDRGLRRRWSAGLQSLSGPGPSGTAIDVPPPPQRRLRQRPPAQSAALEPGLLATRGRR